MHTCRTAHDFDAVVKCGIGQLFGIVRIVAAHGADGRIDAVFADLSDTEAPGLKAGLETLFVHMQSCGGFQCFFQRGRARIIHLFACDNADGLRRVFGRKRQAGSSGHGRYGVAVAAVAPQTAPVGGNGNVCQFAFLYRIDIGKGGNGQHTAQ